MTNPPEAIRGLIVYVLVLPLALLLGYLLATAGAGSYFDVTSWGPIGLVLAVMCLPLLLKSHDRVLYLVWNVTAVVFFLPGAPPLWFGMTVASLTISAAQRAMNKEMRFISAPSIVFPLMFIGAVVLVSGFLTGGFGSRVFGSEQYGGRRYWFIFVSIAAFFAIVARPIEQSKSMFYVGLFFLGSLMNLIIVIIPYLPKEFYWLALIFPVSINDMGAMAFEGRLEEGIPRFLALTTASSGAFCYLLARYGIREMLSAKKLWRFVLLLSVVVLSMFGGFRYALILIGLTFVFLFCLEGLLRTGYAAMFFGVIALTLALLIPFGNKLPLSIQRTLTILPINLDPVARYQAEASSEWRIDMWRTLLPEVPRYLITPKGLGIDGLDLELTSDLARRGLARTQDVSILAGDYHSGPLSIIIPFGIWGFLGWLWFLAACTRALWLNHRYGPEPLQKINTFLLAHFLAKTVVFFFVTGGFYSDLSSFVSIIGLSISLNKGICAMAVRPSPYAQREEPEPIELPLNPVRS